MGPLGHRVCGATFITLFSGLKLTFSKKYQTGAHRFDAPLRAKIILHFEILLSRFFIDLGRYFHNLTLIIKNQGQNQC